MKHEKTNSMWTKHGNEENRKREQEERGSKGLSYEHGRGKSDQCCPCPDSKKSAKNDETE